MLDYAVPLSGRVCRRGSRLLRTDTALKRKKNRASCLLARGSARPCVLVFGRRAVGGLLSLGERLQLCAGAGPARAPILGRLAVCLVRRVCRRSGRGGVPGLVLLAHEEHGHQVFVGQPGGPHAQALALALGIAQVLLQALFLLLELLLLFFETLNFAIQRGLVCGACTSGRGGGSG